jgi:hypothetical protein
VDLPVRRELPEEDLQSSPNPDHLSRVDRLATEVWHAWLKEQKKPGIRHQSWTVLKLRNNVYMKWFSFFDKLQILIKHVVHLTVDK